MKTAETTPYRRVRRSVLCLQSAVAVAVVTAGVGCLQQILFFGYLFGGPPSIEPDFEVQTKQSLTDYEVKVAVVCFAPKKLKWDFHAVDKDIAKFVSHRLNQHHIKVISPDRVQQWLDQKQGDWDTAAEIGAAFKTTYVIDIEIVDYSLYEKGSSTLHRGRSELFVTVWEMDEDGQGTRIYRKEIKSTWPLLAPRSTSEISYSKFRMLYLQRLSEVIGRLFYVQYNGDDIGETT